MTWTGEGEASIEEEEKDVCLDPLFVRAMTWTGDALWPVPGGVIILVRESRSLIRQGNDLDAPERTDRSVQTMFSSRSLIRQGNDLDILHVPDPHSHRDIVSIPYSSGQ